MVNSGPYENFDIMPRSWDRWVVEKLLGDHDDYVAAVAFSPGGKTLVSGLEDKTIRLWNVAPGEKMQKLEGNDDYVTAVDFSPDGKTLVSGSYDKAIRLWYVATGEHRKTLEGHDHWIRAVAFSPDGKTLASGSDDKTVRLWHAMKGKQRQKLEGHDSYVNAVAFSPDGSTVASGSDDKTIRMWTEATEEAWQKRQSSEVAYEIAFLEDGRHLDADIERLDLCSKSNIYCQVLDYPTLGALTNRKTRRGISLGAT